MNKTDPTGLVNLMATLSNRLAWFAGGSILTSREDDLLKQGQARFDAPTGNYKDSDVEHHLPNSTKSEIGSRPGGTIYTVDKVEETEGLLIIKPTLNWYVQPQFKNTSVVKSELEHVSRWLYWQGKGDGAAAVRQFNRNPGGMDNLKATLKAERRSEDRWHENNIHRNFRHNLDVNPPKAMDPAAIRKLIETVGPVEEPYLGD